MKILVISDKEDTSELGTKIKHEFLEFLQKNNYTYKNYDIRKEDLNYCVGCFGCWIKTPGLCVFNDIGREINKEYVQSEAAVFISPVRYGCYSTVIRRVLDRSLPNILPFFKKIGNEVHHAPRYDSYPSFITIGYGEDITAEEADTYNSLANANAMNFQVGTAKTYICRGKAEIQAIMNSFDNYIKEAGK